MPTALFPQYVGNPAMEDFYAADFEIQARNSWTGKFNGTTTPVDMRWVIEAQVPTFANADHMYCFYQSCCNLAPGYAYKLQLCLLSDTHRFMTTIRGEDELFVKVTQDARSQRKKITLYMFPKISTRFPFQGPRKWRTGAGESEILPELKGRTPRLSPRTGLQQRGWLASALGKVHKLHKSLENEFLLLAGLPIPPEDRLVTSPSIPKKFEVWWSKSCLVGPGQWRDV